MVQMIYILYDACLRHIKPGTKYVDADLKFKASQICLDDLLEESSDKRVGLWMCNFRTHLAPYFAELEEHVRAKSSGINKNKKPVYIAMPSDD